MAKIIKPRRRETVLPVTLHGGESKATIGKSQIGIEQQLASRARLPVELPAL